MLLTMLMSLLARVLPPRRARRTAQSQAELDAALEADWTNAELHVARARLARAEGRTDLVRRHLDLAFEYAPKPQF